MKFIKRISLIIVAVIVIACSVPLSALAVDPVTFSEAETLGATIVDLYGAYNNTSLAYDQLSSSGALTEVVTLYQNYSQSASDPYTLAAIGAAAAAAGAIAVIYDAVTGQGYVQLYQEQYISSLDGYWDYQLADAGLVRDSITGFFNWVIGQDNSVNPIVIYSSTGFPLIPVYSGSPSFNYIVSNGYWIKDWSDSNHYYAMSSMNNTFVFVSTGDNRIYFVNQSPFYLKYANGTNTVDTMNNNITADNYYRGWMNNGGQLINPDIPVYSSWSSGISAYNGYVPSNIEVSPSNYIGDPLTNPLEITIPDPYSPSYDPQPKRITTTIPWNPDWGDPLPDGVSTPEYGVPYPITDPSILNEAVPAIWDSIVSDGVEIQDSPEPVDPAPGPSEVYIPFLPVTLPSFQFSLSGIWHYVTAWVASLGAWFSLVFMTWSYLPYAISVPVYATAVIVIVLGVYKRFFM